MTPDEQKRLNAEQHCIRAALESALRREREDRALIDQLRAKLAEAERERDREDHRHGRTIDERDKHERNIERIHAHFECEREWSNCHDLGVCAALRAGEIVAERDALRAEVERLKAEARRCRRSAVDSFADLMERTLRANDHKGGWDECDAEWLLSRLREETEELAKLLPPWGRWNLACDSGSVAREAADVANFAMMIADVCGGLPATAASAPKVAAVERVEQAAEPSREAGEKPLTRGELVAALREATVRHASGYEALLWLGNKLEAGR